MKEFLPNSLSALMHYWDNQLYTCMVAGNIADVTWSADASRGLTWSLHKPLDKRTLAFFLSLFSVRLMVLSSCIINKSATMISPHVTHITYTTAYHCQSACNITHMLKQLYAYTLHIFPICLLVHTYLSYTNLLHFQHLYALKEIKYNNS